MLFPPVPADELAFAMSLFVSAANARQPGTRVFSSQEDDRSEGERLFFTLSFRSPIPPEPSQRASLLATSLYNAFSTVWQQYAGDPRRRSILARIVCFCALMEQTQGALVEGWTMPTQEGHETLILHPAVVDALACVALSESGFFTASALTGAIEKAAHDPLADAPFPSRTGEPAESAWPVGNTETASLIRNLDWSETAVGPMHTWPQSLRTVIDLTLACRFPMIVLWGPGLIQFYNDAYRDIMGSKHPGGIGQPTQLCWPEVWHINEPLYARVRQGESITFEDQLYPIHRYGYLEDAFFTLCYSPLRNEASAIQGVLVTVFETTPRTRFGQDSNLPIPSQPLNDPSRASAAEDGL